MGTNFYSYTPVKKFTDEDGDDAVLYEVDHLGKRSGGWLFCSSFNRWDEMLDALRTAEFVRDEYGTIYTPQEFLGILVLWNTASSNTRIDGSGVRETINLTSVFGVPKGFS